MALCQEYALRLLGVICCRISFFHVPFGSTFRSQPIVSSPGVCFEGCLMRWVCIVLLRIVAHAFLITWAPFRVSLLFTALAICAVSTVEIGGMPASFSRIRLPTARYAPRTLRRFLFCSTSSLRSTCFREVATPCGAYHAEAPYVMAGRTTEVYTSRAILKLAPHVDVEMRSIAGDWEAYSVNYNYVREVNNKDYKIINDF